MQSVKPASLVQRWFRFCRLLLHFAKGLLIVALIYPRKNSEWQRATVQRWGGQLLNVLNVEMRVHGELPPGKKLLVSNHISWLDNFVVQALCPAHFVAKSEIRDWPVMGWLVAHTGALFIERARRHHTLKINQDMMAALDSGDSVALFPEGTTGTGDHVRPFHSSLLQACIGSNAPLVPIGLRYVAQEGEQTHAADYVGEMNFLTSLKNILREKKIIAELRIGPSVNPGGKSRRDLAYEAEQAVARLLGLAPPHRTLKTLPDPPAETH
ncbi:MAG: lysophospholipid acyltransferase family protein [Burkholderiales bacterium]